MPDKTIEIKPENGLNKSSTQSTSSKSGLDLINAIQNDTTVHKSLIEEIESKTKRNLICYTAFFGHPAGSIKAPDASLIETVLQSINFNRYPDTLDLMIHTLGGDPLEAEKLILTCRSYAKSFRVIIPKTAMSAGTLIAMGADSILMSETSELGPIDPQMPADNTLRPAVSFIEAYEDLIKKSQDAINQKLPPHPYLELLKKMDPTWIQICLRAEKFARKIAEEYLGKYMLNGTNPDEVKNVVNNFIKEGADSSHGRVIRAEKAKLLGLKKIEIIDLYDPLWQCIRELHLRTEHYVQAKVLAKYFVCHNGGLNVNVQLLKA